MANIIYSLPYTSEMGLLLQGNLPKWNDKGFPIGKTGTCVLDEIHLKYVKNC